MQRRRAALDAELANTNDKLSRLYSAIEDGIVELDHQLKKRIETLKKQRDVIVASLERMVTQARTTSAITPERLQSFARLMQEKFESGDVQAKKPISALSSRKSKLQMTRSELLGKGPP